jgi:hypothetical protein
MILLDCPDDPGLDCPFYTQTRGVLAETLIDAAKMGRTRFGNPDGIAGEWLALRRESA